MKRFVEPGDIVNIKSLRQQGLLTSVDLDHYNVITLVNNQFKLLHFKRKHLSFSSKCLGMPLNLSKVQIGDRVAIRGLLSTYNEHQLILLRWLPSYLHDSTNYTEVRRVRICSVNNNGFVAHPKDLHRCWPTPFSNYEIDIRLLEKV